MDGTFETAERIGGYRVVRHLARGSTSDVILARAEGPHGFARTVVLKVLLPELTRDPGVARKFAREASACAQLSHPAIVRLYDFFSLSVLEAQGAHLEEGQLVMVLEYVDGVPLNRLKSAVKAGGHTFDDRAALHVGTRLFSALAAAHEAVDDRGDPAPLIHRDVNPTNVLVPWDGHVKLADFGVAKVSGSSQDTQTGLLRGTYGYMAPEQVTGERPVTPRADVYAAAIIMWELLARRRAFQRGALGEVEALRAMAEPRLTSLDVLRPDVDASVRAALRRALEPDAEQRTITAEEMVAVLRKVAPAELARQRLADLAERVRHEVDRLAPSRPPPKGERISGVDVQALVASRPPSKGPSQPPPKRDSEMPTFTPRAAPVVPVPRPPPRPDPSPSPPAVGAFRLRQESIEDIMSDGRRERPSERELKTPIGSVGPGRSLGDAIDEILEAAPAPSSGAKYPISLDNATHRRPLSSEPERTLGRSEIEAVGRFPSTAPSPPTGLSETLAVASSGAGRSDPPPRTQPLHDRTLAMAQAPPRPAPISNRPQSGAQTLASSQPPAASDGPAKPPLPSNRGKPPLPNTARAGGTRPLQATPAPSPAASGSVRAAPAAPTTAPAYVP
ncbi:MAG: protein kinase, partial [Myxococcales bacterium]|nr:protein kinase [Myxococcales bacterium]